MALSLDSIPYRKPLFAAFAALVMLFSLEDLVSEFGNEEGLAAMLDDVLMFAASVVVLLAFALDYVQQQRTLGELQGQLNAMRGKLEGIDEQSLGIARQYRAVIQTQFDQWQLTPSEQEIALALIKGLSFREVAEVRNTREKTVRQQAAVVYRKANLSGRHELAGWFFEDLLDPPTVASDTTSNVTE